mgnify:CR=1 FL=1
MLSRRGLGSSGCCIAPHIAPEQLLIKFKTPPWWYAQVGGARSLCCRHTSSPAALHAPPRPSAAAPLRACEDLGDQRSHDEVVAVGLPRLRHSQSARSKQAAHGHTAAIYDSNLDSFAHFLYATTGEIALPVSCCVLETSPSGSLAASGKYRASRRASERSHALQAPPCRPPACPVMTFRRVTAAPRARRCAQVRASTAQTGSCTCSCTRKRPTVSQECVHVQRGQARRSRDRRVAHSPHPSTLIGLLQS